VHWGWFLLATEGRINRAPYWIFNIFLSLAYLTFWTLMRQEPDEVWQKAEFYFIAVVLWPNLAVQAKRWHDTGRSALWILVNFIPIIGPLYALVMTGFIKGTTGKNRFGSDPLEVWHSGK